MFSLTFTVPSDLQTSTTTKGSLESDSAHYILQRGKTQITHVLSHIRSAFRPPNIHNHKGVLKAVVLIMWGKTKITVSPMFFLTFTVPSDLQTSTIAKERLESCSTHHILPWGKTKIIIFTHVPSHIHSVFRPPNIHDRNKGDLRMAAQYPSCFTKW